MYSVRRGIPVPVQTIQVGGDIPVQNSQSNPHLPVVAVPFLDGAHLEVDAEVLDVEGELPHVVHLNDDPVEMPFHGHLPWWNVTGGNTTGGNVTYFNTTDVNTTNMNEVGVNVTDVNVTDGDINGRKMYLKTG
jgi:hypothetical protein